MDLIHEAELKKLDEKITELSSNLEKLSYDGGKALKDALIYIHHPKWTTPAELAFSTIIIEGLLHQLQNVKMQIEGFQRSSIIVTEKEMV